MKAFRFRLKKLLDVRRVEEEQSALRLKAATANLREIDARIERCRRDHAEVYRELGISIRAGSLRPEAPVQAAAHAARLERAIREAERERADAEKLVRQAVQDLRRRRTARRALEELQAREVEAWKEGIRREENGFLDEVASTRHFKAR